MTKQQNLPLERWRILPVAAHFVEIHLNTAQQKINVALDPFGRDNSQLSFERWVQISTEIGSPGHPDPHLFSLNHFPSKETVCCLLFLNCPYFERKVRGEEYVHIGWFEGGGAKSERRGRTKGKCIIFAHVDSSSFCVLLQPRHHLRGHS